jgi:uncharacterized protein YydD (DUF2326 family)
MARQIDKPAVDDIVGRIATQLGDVAEPLEAVLAEADAALAELEAEKTRLKNQREEAMRVLKILRPDKYQPLVRKYQRKKENAHERGVSEEKLNALTDWLKEHVDGEGFWAMEIVRRPTFDLMSQATLSKALELLADRGTVRLDRVQGSRKVFKLTGTRNG